MTLIRIFHQRNHVPTIKQVKVVHFARDTLHERCISQFQAESCCSGSLTSMLSRRFAATSVVETAVKRPCGTANIRRSNGPSSDQPRRALSRRPYVDGKSELPGHEGAKAESSIQEIGAEDEPGELVAQSHPPADVSEWSPQEMTTDRGAQELASHGVTPPIPLASKPRVELAGDGSRRHELS